MTALFHYSYAYPMQYCDGSINIFVGQIHTNYQNFDLGLLRNRLTEVGGHNFQKARLIQAQKLHPVVRFLVFLVIFETTAGALRQKHFFDLHVIVLVKNGRITTSLPIILSINQ